MLTKKTVKDINVSGKSILLRVDYNVPFSPHTSNISDDSRIRASIPTIDYLLKKDCKIIICSHMGRPKGKIVDVLKMKPVSDRLSEILGITVTQAIDCTGHNVKASAQKLLPRQVMMLENLRFHSGEEENNVQFASELASLAQIYVNDAFGSAHRAHASTEGVTHFITAVAGLLMAKELDILGQALEAQERPLVAILGGAKISDKIGVLENLAGKVDKLIIGGGMAATFLKAKGLNIGNSLVDKDKVKFATDFIKTTNKEGPYLFLPLDAIISTDYASGTSHKVVDISNIEEGYSIFDIGPRTTKLYIRELLSAKTVIWNGPMGIFEFEAFSQGTAGIAHTLSSLTKTTTIIGGGSTAEAVINLGLGNKMTHVSTGGGASLEFLEGKLLPGVAALMNL